MNDNTIGTILLAILGVVCMCIGNCAGRQDMEKKWKQEVVERGHATWKVNPDGTTEFIWK